jgi:hypothetical protein
VILLEKVQEPLVFRVFLKWLKSLNEGDRGSVSFIVSEAGFNSDMKVNCR